MTEKREPYIVNAITSQNPSSPVARVPWNDVAAFGIGWNRALATIHGGLFLEPLPEDMSAAKLVQKIRAACLAGELGGGGE